MEKPWDNETRNRYYGLRVGDIVNALGMQCEVRYANAEVVGYGQTDNNRIYLRMPGGENFSWVAEWCRIVEKIEDRK